jgi:hypothetical protein
MRCEHVMVQPFELYYGRQCAGAALGDARWHSLPATTHALQSGEHAMLHFPGQDGGPRGDNYFPCTIRRNCIAAKHKGSKMAQAH